jgi:hypothetical protein
MGDGLGNELKEIGSEVERSIPAGVGRLGSGSAGAFGLGVFGSGSQITVACGWGNTVLTNPFRLRMPFALEVTFCMEPFAPHVEQVILTVLAPTLWANNPLQFLRLHQIYPPFGSVTLYPLYRMCSARSSFLGLGLDRTGRCALAQLDEMVPAKMVS